MILSNQKNFVLTSISVLFTEPAANNRLPLYSGTSASAKPLRVS